MDKANRAGQAANNLAVFGSFHMQTQISYRQIALISLLLLVMGWLGLALLVVFTLPTLGPRWLFYFLFMLGVCGFSLPVASFLHRRFPEKPPADFGVVIRQAIWVGIYADFLVWLQLGRAFQPERAIFLGLGFVILELLLRMIERSRWKPKEDING